MESLRSDRRGHWPAGRRRQPNVVSWGKVRLRLERFLAAYHERGTVSQRALAADLGVSDRSVGRWLRGEDRPRPEMQLAVEAWLK